MFTTETAASVWQTLYDQELRDLTLEQFRGFAELRLDDEEDIMEAWADFEDARSRVFGMRPTYDCTPSAGC